MDPIDNKMGDARRHCSGGAKFLGPEVMGSESKWSTGPLTGSMAPPQAGRGDTGRRKWASGICSGQGGSSHLVLYDRSDRAGRYRANGEGETWPCWRAGEPAHDMSWDCWAVLGPLEV